MPSPFDLSEISNEREGEITANGVDGVQARSRFRRELDFVHTVGFFHFDGFLLSGNVYV